MPPLLEVRDLVAGYGTPAVLRGVSLEIEAGDSLSVVGRNGSGKSTLVRCLMGYLRPAGGSARLDGRDLAGRRPHEVVRMGMTAVLQERSAFGRLSVRENLLVGGYLLDRATRGRRVTELLARFPLLEDKRRMPANRLSSGEQRILEIARALMLDPRVLILDEATIGLSAAFAEEMRALVRRLRADGTAVLIAESDGTTPLDPAGARLTLSRGLAIETSPTHEEELSRDGRVAKTAG
jgi:branched-chain amino acid transport system ATP-binding protein